MTARVFAPVLEPEARTVREKFAATRRELSEALIECDGEVDLVLTALVCNEHPLLVGEPGTAKSLLLDSLMAWTSGRRFSALLTKFTSPDSPRGRSRLYRSCGATHREGSATRAGSACRAIGGPRAARRCLVALAARTDDFLPKQSRPPPLAYLAGGLDAPRRPPQPTPALAL